LPVALRATRACGESMGEAGNERAAPGARPSRPFGPHFDLITRTWIMQGRDALDLPSEGSDDSERMAADLNVDDWANEPADWQPEGELWGSLEQILVPEELLPRSPAKPVGE
jgi:hypothetical protein